MNVDRIVAFEENPRFVYLAGKTDKAGNPYAEHPRRVSELLVRVTPDADEDMLAAAWLHDVLEDTPVTSEVLSACGISQKAIHIVQLLTRRDDVSPEDYYQSITEIEPARLVKLADVADNNDETRLAQLPAELASRLRAKYEAAGRALGDRTDRS